MAINDYLKKYYGSDYNPSSWREENEAVRVGREVSNLERRLDSVGEKPPESKLKPLIFLLQNISRPGYGVMNSIREFTSPSSGATPGVRDPLRAFGRGFSLKEKATGKDVMTDLGVSDEPWFRTHVGPVEIAPNPAGVLGFAADVLNPLDPLNWIGVGLAGKTSKYGLQTTLKGMPLAEKALGRETAGELAEKLGRDWMDTLNEPTVGQLVRKLSDRGNKLNIEQGVNPSRISELLQQGVEKTGLRPESRIQDKIRKSITLGIQAPIVNKKLGEVYLPGSHLVTGAIGDAADAIKKTPFGQAVGQSFSTNFIPENVPPGVWTRFVRQGIPKKEGDISNLLPPETRDIIGGAPAKVDEIMEDIQGNITHQKPEDLIVSPTMEKRLEELHKKYPGIFDNITAEMVEKNEYLVQSYRDAAKKLEDISDEFRVVDYDRFREYIKGNYDDLLDQPIQLRHAVRNELQSRIKELKDNADILHKELYGDRNIPLSELKEMEGNKTYSELTTGLKRMAEKSRITEQQFERYVADIFKGIDEDGRKQIMKAAIDPSVELEDTLKPALDAFTQWRQDVVDAYNANGVTFTPLEEYVPFIATGKPLTKDELGLLRGLFGTGIHEAQNNDLLEMIGKMDQNLRERTTKAIDPAEINKVLGREWLTEDAAVAMARRGVKAIRGQEAATFLAGMAKKYGLTLEDVSQLKNLPQGYVVIQPKPISSGRILLEPEKDFAAGRAMALPQEFVKAYNDYVDLLFNPEAQTKLGKFFDQVTRAYKTMAYMWNPGHIPRDFMSNVYNLWLADVRNPIPYVKAGRVMQEMSGIAEESLFSFPKWEGTGRELYGLLEELGVTDSGSVLAEFMQAGSDWSFRMGGKYTDVMRKITRANDNYARIAGAIDFMSKGATPEQAAAQVKKFLFDYFDLTPFEKRFMKRVVPFYTWLRKNLPLQVEMFLTKPGKYATTYKATESMGDIPTDEEAPSFIAEAGGFRLPGPEGEGGTYVIPNLSYADLGKVPMNIENVRELAAMINPVIRSPIEMLTNTSLFSGQPIERYKGESQSIPFGQLLESLGLVESAPQVSSRTTGYLLDQIPPLRTASTISNPEHPRQVARLLSVLGGPQIYPSDWAKEAATYERRDDLRSLVRALEDQGLQVPTTRELDYSRRGVAISGIRKYMGMMDKLK